MPMILENFELESNPQTVELTVGGEYFDLHNHGDFLGFNFDTINRALRLSWRYFAKSECPEKATHEFFVEVLPVSFLSFTHWDIEMPFKELLCLFGISRVIPGAPEEFRFPLNWGPTDEFNLLFQFMNGLEIEVGGERARIRVERLGASKLKAQSGL
jgi:hypothetical protein